MTLTAFYSNTFHQHIHKILITETNKTVSAHLVGVVEEVNRKKKGIQLISTNKTISAHLVGVVEEKTRGKGGQLDSILFKDVLSAHPHKINNCNQ